MSRAKQNLGGVIAILQAIHPIDKAEKRAIKYAVRVLEEHALSNMQTKVERQLSKLGHSDSTVANGEGSVLPDGQVQYTSTVYNEDGTSETHTYPPGPPITLDDLAKLNGERHLPMNEHGFPIYPKGTPIKDVKEFDRGQKVVFQCKRHPDSIWASKDPYTSRWFAAKREYEECDCGLNLTYVLAEDYSPTRNG